MTYSPHLSVLLAPRAKDRGFSLVEVMVVVVLIAVLAALAVPAAGRQMRDLRVRRAAGELAILYRDARAHGLDRGAAVRFTYDGAAGTVTATEARLPGGLPWPLCTSGTWSTPFLRATAASLGVTIAAKDTGGTARTFLEVCFAPSGRTLVRTSNTTPLSTMAGAAELQVGAGQGLPRSIALLPGGDARVFTPPVP